MEPLSLITPNFSGRHNADLNLSAMRLNIAHSAQDLSTICLIPNDGLLSAVIVERWLGQVSQMNQKFVRLPIINPDKYFALNGSIENILATPKLNEFKYILTMEQDSLPPFDGLIRLFESMDNFDVVGGLLYTKGEESKPMIYGHPQMIPSSYTPVSPMGEGIQPCLGLGTGFTLFKLDIFKNPLLTKPWFRSNPGFEVGKPTNVHPDMYLFENLHKLGYKVACDTRIKVGHFDAKNDIVW